MQAWCQKNFIVGINDANPWLDKKLPGTFFTCGKAGSPGLPASFLAGDCGPPSNPDPDIDVTALTNTVGSMEGLNGALWKNDGSTWTSGTVSGVVDSIGYVPGVSTDAGSCTPPAGKTVTALGEIMGTCPYPAKENSYYIAGLAYYANTHDIRSDLDNKQTIATYMIDTQEFNANPLDGPKNMLWLAGKYGGFIDSNLDNNPNISSGGSATSEWDSDGDGVPDNYVLATQPEKLVAGLSSAFSDIVKRTGSASSVATSTTELKTGSKNYQAQFSSGEWSGTLISSLISDGSTEWDAGTLLNSQVSTSSDTRQIITKGNTGDGVAFQYANLTVAQKANLDADETATVDGRGTDRVGYLRGQSQFEGVAAGTFRARPTRKLGDIINSNPWYNGEPSAGYSDVDYSGYSAFRTTYKDRFPVVYVGANDGMLHGFNACEVGVQPGCNAGDPGKELIAYVPTTVYPNLSKLTSQSYKDTHQYFVDGSPMVGDAVVSSAWRSVLIGSMNSGGKGYFALEVTDPADGTKTAPTFSETNAAALLLWEFTSADDADLGLTYNLPPVNFSNSQARQIVRMANGKWAAIVGNGYNSTSGHAALYVIFLDGPTGGGGAWTAGTDYIKLVADTSGSNGLSTPVPFDSDGDGFVDTVYAGDLKGQLWKFHVGPNAEDASVTSVPGTWKVAFSGSPLFTAVDTLSNPQPIISPPEVTLHPTSGLMVLFGTGKYLENSDLTSTLVQTFYGIQDAGAPVAGRSDLNQVVLGTTFSRTASAGVAAATPKGWYADLSIAGERVVGRPRLESGIIFFDTIVPSTAACTGGVSSSNQGLNYLTGLAPDFAIYDATGDGVIDAADIGYIGISTGSALGGTTFIKGASGTSGTEGRGLSSQLTGGVTQFLVNLGPGSRGRISWRELVQ